MGLLNILDLMSSKNKVLTEFKNNNFKLALKYLEEIIKVEPNDENNYNFKGIILQSMNRSGEARQSWLIIWEHSHYLLKLFPLAGRLFLINWNPFTGIRI